MYLTSFLGAFKAAAQKKKVSFVFPYSLAVWHLVSCLKRNKLIRYSCITQNKTHAILIVIFLAYQATNKGEPLCRSIRYYHQQHLNHNEINTYLRTRHNLLRPVLIGWNSGHQTFCAVNDFALQMTGRCLGLQGPVFLVD